jgi:hypothetical protein
MVASTGRLHVETGARRGTSRGVPHLYYVREVVWLTAPTSLVPVTIAGQVVYEQGAPATTAGQIRIMATPGNPEEMSLLPTPQPAVVKPDLTFMMKGLLGEFLLRASGPDQYLKSVTVGNEDVTDSAREFKANERVTITLTSRVSTLEGNVTDATGAATTDAAVLLFSQDKTAWRFNSTRTKRAVVDPNGHFHVTGLMPGRYLVAATQRDRLAMPASAADVSFFEELSKEATSLVLGEDEQRKVDLKVAARQ